MRAMEADQKRLIRVWPPLAAKRIFDRLREEQQAEVSYTRVRACVAVRRGAILAESGRAPVEVFVPQSHWPGGEAEVDFGDVVVEL